MHIGTDGHLGVNVAQLVMSLELQLVIELVYQHYGVVNCIVEVYQWKESLVFYHAADVSCDDILETLFSCAHCAELW